ncbi:MAG: winged helix-turn-helix transcriptional regulator [Candidatus Aenigmarchaeota archaeon]|nr:winged helix-turn-helix transcriptional regulator [Candidatus Aenigmarchaeota archaeon]
MKASQTILQVEKIKPSENDEVLTKIAKLFYGLTLKDFDVIAAVTGPKGMGKSSLAIQLSRQILKLQEKEFEPERHVAYLYEDVINKINELDEHEPLIIDEAVNVMMGEDWNKIESKYLKKVFAKLRVRHLIVFLCIPKFEWLDKKYREGMVNALFLVPTRGTFIFLTPKPFSDDPWEEEKLKKVFGKLDYFTLATGTINKIVLNQSLKQLGIDATFGEFREVDERIYNKYKAMREAAIEKSSEQGEVLKIEASKIPLIIKINEMKNLGITNKEIAKQLGISEAAVSKYLKLISGSSK